MSQRDRDLRRVSELRAARERAVAEAASGLLASVLSLDGADDRSQTYVVKLLDVTPGVGKVAGRRLLGALGIEESVRAADLTEAQRSAIVEGCARVAGSHSAGAR